MLETLPLLNLFYRLQKEPGFSLGMENYFALIEALRGGFGQPDKEALRMLCSMLWVKTRDPQLCAIFNAYFDQALQDELTVLPVVPATPLSIATSQVESGGEAPPEGGDTIQPAALEPIIPAPPQPQTDVEQKLAELVGTEPRADEFSEPEFILRKIPAIYPVSSRQMKQTWRSLRRMLRTGPATELDINATIERIGREGMFAQAVLMPRRVNQAQVLILVDHDGSMVPYSPVVDAVLDSAVSAGRLGAVGVYYFHNYPSLVEGGYPDELFDDDYFFYRRAYSTDSVSLQTILRGFAIGQTSVLIVSDAGAARGERSQKRVNATRAFLEFLRFLRIRNCVWLNPIPREKWEGTTAAEIQALPGIHMFPLTPVGLSHTLRALGGRSVPQAASSTGEGGGVIS